MRPVLRASFPLVLMILATAAIARAPVGIAAAGIASATATPGPSKPATATPTTSTPATSTPTAAESAGSQTSGASQGAPEMREADRIRIAEAFTIADEIGDDLWSGWSEVPFAVLLVTPDHSFLVRHPKPSEDFTPAGYDSLLGSDVYFRKRVYPPNLLATFGAVSGVPTVVIGQPEQTGKSSTAWTVTLLHEHFHQLQWSTPGNAEAVAGLDLSGGDESGMWMLNYPFPYESEELGKEYLLLSEKLLQAFRSIGTEDFEEHLREYLDKRSALMRSLPSADYRYMSFQLWQEGIARYTEYRAAKMASERHSPTKAFRALPDFITFSECAKKILDGTVGELEELSLPGYGRVAFYPVGAVEAMLLDEVNQGWRSLYFKEPFYLEDWFHR